MCIRDRFHSGQVFHQFVCPLTVVLPQIFFNLTTLFSLFHAPLDVVVHFLVFRSSFRLGSFLSQFSPFVAQIKNFCSDPGCFFWRCLPKISLAVSITAVLKVVIIESMSVSSLLMMVRGANLPPIMAWKPSNHKLSKIYKISPDTNPHKTKNTQTSNTKNFRRISPFSIAPV